MAYQYWITNQAKAIDEDVFDGLEATLFYRFVTEQLEKFYAGEFTVYVIREQRLAEQWHGSYLMLDMADNYICVTGHHQYRDSLRDGLLAYARGTEVEWVVDDE